MRENQSGALSCRYSFAPSSDIAETADPARDRVTVRRRTSFGTAAASPPSAPACASTPARRPLPTQAPPALDSGTARGGRAEASP